VGERLVELHGAALESVDEAEWLPRVRNVAVEAMMVLIREDLAEIGIRHDMFASEAALIAPEDQIAALIEDLEARGLVYQGVLPKPKGAENPEWEAREQRLFRATRFGDEIDRPLQKADGSYTYFAFDIAYHASKFRRGFHRMIDVWGADHGGYIKRMQAAVNAVTNGEGTLEVRICQLVKLLRDGEPVKMSKRAGDFVTLREVVAEVGRDAVRFMMLSRRNDAALDFDLAKLREQSKDNPVFYVQYAHARAASVLKRGVREVPEFSGEPSELASAAFSRLVEPLERGLMRKLAGFPRVIEQAVLVHEPHRVAFFLSELAAQFHAWWTAGKEAPDLRFIKPDDASLSVARLALAGAVAQVMANGLALLGVSAPDEMR
jgi:arginyl-tRNA synthetase